LSLKMLRMVLYIIVALGFVFLLLAGYAALIEPYWLEVVNVPVRSALLPDAFVGITIAQVSDFHLGNSNNQAKLHAAIDRVLALRPDLILLTGDFVTTVRSGEAQVLEAELARLSARLGVYAILGNHDWWSDPIVVAGALRRARVTLLNNSNARLDRNGASLYLAGLEDIYFHPDLAQALAGIPADAPLLLMAHEPDQAEIAKTDGRIFLQVSGHTHGGQIRLLGIHPLALPRYGRKYDAGLFQVGSMQLYVNRGVGVTLPPLRLLCRPEITLFTLGK
jgi:predicted MPP superfamily phosphohydrolase